MAIVSPRPGALPEVESGRSYCDWPAIFTGAIFAAAFSLVLLTFGTALGLSIVSAEPGEGVSMLWWGIAAGLWFIWVAVSSFGAGGYLAGRMRRPVADATEDEIETRDGVHGLTVWAAGTLVATLLALGGVGGLMGAATTATGTAVEGAASLVDDQGDYFANMLLRDEAGTSPAPEARAEVTTILARSVVEGDISPMDRDRLVQIAAAQAGTEPAEVEQRVDQALVAFDEARQDAIEVAEQARVAGLITAFVVAATMVVSAAVAYFAATLGGSHRDRGVSLSRFSTSRPR